MPTFDPTFYERILELVPMAVTVLDASGRLMYINKQGEKLFGVPRSQLLGAAFNESQFHITGINGEAVDDDRLPFRVVMNTRRPVTDLCHAVQMRGQQRRILSISGTPFLDREGQVQYVVFSLDDITEQLQTAEQLGRVRDAIEDASHGGHGTSDRSSDVVDLRTLLGSILESPR